MPDDLDMAARLDPVPYQAGRLAGLREAAAICRSNKEFRFIGEQFADAIERAIESAGAGEVGTAGGTGNAPAGSDRTPFTVAPTPAVCDCGRAVPDALPHLHASHCAIREAAASASLDQGEHGTVGQAAGDRGAQARRENAAEVAPLAPAPAVSDKYAHQSIMESPGAHPDDAAVEARFGAPTGEHGTVSVAAVCPRCGDEDDHGGLCLDVLAPAYLTAQQVRVIDLRVEAARREERASADQMLQRHKDEWMEAGRREQRAKDAAICRERAARYSTGTRGWNQSMDCADAIEAQP